MPQAEVSDGVSIAYDTFGDPGDPPVLLVIGFGAQLIGWHDDFCAMLAGRGRYVIRYDNRDSGLSTKFDDHPVDIGAFIAAVRSGDIAAAQAMAPYSLQRHGRRRPRPAYRAGHRRKPTSSAPRWAE